MTTNEALISKARNAKKNSYAKYSGFAVGAAVLTKDGSIYSGCNVENASYGLTVCAERSAIFNAISAGHLEIVKIAISAGSGDEQQPTELTPCGACRQVMAEFASNDLLVIVDGVGEFSIEELLPIAFRLPS